MHATTAVRTLCIAAIVSTVSAWAGSATWGQSVEAQLDQIKLRLAQVEKQQQRMSGRDIYQAGCAPCHGLAGDGRGPASKGFAQHPTDFTKGTYKLRSTLARVPADGDLERTIRTGMPGSEMVPFRHMLSEASISAVAAYIKTFSTTFDNPDEAVIARQKRVQVPADRPFPRSDETVAKGKQIYEQRCQECHGDKGEGSTTEKDDWGFPVVMQDFRRSVFKAGFTDQDLVRTVLTGVNGTSMGPYGGEVSVDEAFQVVDYIRSLVPKQTGWQRLMTYLFVERPNRFDYSAD
jgi:cytochrome c oxidase cbb3-type subunit 2